MEYTNSVLETEQSYICISRPRRFGKSIAASDALLQATWRKDEEAVAEGAITQIKENSLHKHWENIMEIYY